jgi:hypothetical protein
LINDNDTFFFTGDMIGGRISERLPAAPEVKGLKSAKHETNPKKMTDISLSLSLSPNLTQSPARLIASHPRRLDENSWTVYVIGGAVI